MFTRASRESPNITLQTLFRLSCLVILDLDFALDLELYQCLSRPRGGRW